MDILTVREAASLLRCSLAQVYRLYHRGELVGFRVGAAVRIRKQSVEDYMQKGSNHRPAPVVVPELEPVKRVRKNEQGKSGGTPSVTKYFDDILRG